MIMEGGKRYARMGDIEAYRISFRQSNRVWDMVSAWDSFAKDTVGKQFVRATDSISANIAVGFGRYGKKDRIRFYRYSLGSVKESLDWNQKAKVRKLLTDEEYKYILSQLQMLPLALHSLIKYTREKLPE
jgi:four helix bundle protein